MAANITFWYMPEEEGDLLRLFDADSRVVALPLESVSKPMEETALSPRQLIDRDNPSRMFLVLRPHLGEVVYVQYEKDGKTFVGIDAVNSPVLSFSRSIFRDENKLGQAAISAQLDRLTDSKTKVIKKSDEFITWANSIISQTRKMTPKWHQYKSYRITNRVAEAVKNGLTLVF